MKIKWTQNLGLKIGSLVFAAILWLLVTNINDPVIPQSFANIPVRIINTEVLGESDLVYEVLEGTDIISKVTILAPRSIIGKLSGSSIIATADMKDLSSLDTISIKLAVNNAYDIVSISGSSDIVKLKIEKKISKTLAVRATTSGELTQGYILGDITLEQNLVIITGPQSLIESVVAAAADIDVTPFTGDIDTDAAVSLYDAEGKKVDSDRIIQNIKKVRVKIPILETKWVPIDYTVSGTPVAGFQTTGVTEIAPQSVLVAGKSSAIKKFYGIQIPDTVVDVTESAENYVKTVDLAQYLPEGIRLVNPLEDEAVITVYIEREASKNVMVKENRIKIINMPEGFRGNFTGVEDEAAVVLIGLKNNLDLIRGADLSGEIDVKKMMAAQNMDKLTEGFYTVEVDLNIENNVTVLEPMEVILHVIALED